MMQSVDMIDVCLFALLIAGFFICWLVTQPGHQLKLIHIHIFALCFLAVLAWEAYSPTLSALSPAHRAQNPCPADREKDYGTYAVFDGIRIAGSQRFVSKTALALQTLYPTPSYRFARHLRLIRESSNPPSKGAMAWYQRGIMEALPETAELACTIYAGVIAHEGAHAVYGAGHGPVFAAQAQALREMGEPTAAAATYARIAEQ